LDFLDRVYRAHFGRLPASLREDFAGTAYTATVDTTFTWNGETHSLNLVARVNAQDGKTYYALDANGDGVHDTNDRVTHNWLDGLLNGGADTVDTQSGGAVKGVDDARTVIINGNTWVLPTLAELNALYNDPTVANPPAGSGNHNNENLNNGNQNSNVSVKSLPPVIPVPGSLA
jgi:hypothetical protein